MSRQTFNITFFLVICAWSTDPAKGADQPQLGFSYRASGVYSDGGLLKTDSVDAEAKSNISLESAKLSLMGNATPSVKYMVRYNLLSQEKMVQGVELAWLKLTLPLEMISVTVGRAKVNQGGWQQKDRFKEWIGIDTDAAFAYSKQTPFDTFSDMIALNFAVAGQLSLQFLDDVVQKDVNQDGATDNPWVKNKSEKGLATTVEWIGDFGGWMPLLQFSSYDLNQSHALSIGLKGAVASLGIFFNYTTDARNNVSQVPAGGKEEMDTLTQTDVSIEYTIADFTPSVGYHSFDYKQGGVDRKTNAKAGSIDDNAQAVSAALSYYAFGNGYVPYISVNSDSGAYADANGGEENRSGMTYKAGVRGRF